MHAKVALHLTGPMDHLRLVWQTGETLLDSVMFEEDNEGNRYNVLLALQEMVTNVLRHAYDHDVSRPVVVEFEVEDAAFCVTLRDQGPEFDPLNCETQDVVLDTAMPEQAGGFGIHITKMVMDEVTYERKDGWNCLRMVRETSAKARV